MPVGYSYTRVTNVFCRFWTYSRYLLNIVKVLCQSFVRFKRLKNVDIFATKLKMSRITFHRNLSFLCLKVTYALISKYLEKRFISLNLLLNISFRIQKLPFTFPDHTQQTTHNNFGRKSILTLNYSRYILIFTSCLALLLLLIYISSLLL